METKDETMKDIGVIGSGKIGRQWAVLFTGAGLRVRLQDVNEKLLDEALVGIKKIATELENDGLLRGDLSIAERLALISTTTSLDQCLKDAYYIQECIPEDLTLKVDLFSKLDTMLNPETVVASSTSTIPPSKFTESMKNRQNCLVAHPINPPLLCPLVELVPAPWTAPEAVDRAEEIMKACRQVPVRLSREVVGFAANRLQYAVVAECWRLVMDGVMTAEDVDKVVSEGIGLRWAFYGPLAVQHMNGNGITDHNQRYHQGFENVCNSFGEPPDLVDPVLLEIGRKQVEDRLPLDETRKRRDAALKALVKLKQTLQL